MIKKKTTIILLLFMLVANIFIFQFCNPEEAPYFEPSLYLKIIDSDPSWSSDGTRIAYFHSDTSISKCGIYLIKPDGTENILWQQGLFESLAWSPDGQWIAFSKNAQIWIRKINGDSIIQITTEGRNFFPRWSSNGDFLVYCQTICETIPCGLWFYQIEELKSKFIMRYGMFSDFNPVKNEIIFNKRWVEENGNVAGDSVFTYDYLLLKKISIVTLKDPNYSNSYFRFNRTGTKILFLSQAKGEAPALWSMNSDGTDLKKIISNSYIADWNPEGSKIIFTETHSTGRLWTMNNDGSYLQQLTFKNHFIK